MVDLVLLGGTPQHDRVTSVLQCDDQLPGSLHRLNLADEPAVLLAFGRPKRVAVVVLGLITAQRGHDLVAAHDHVPVDSPRCNDVVKLAAAL